MYSLSSKDFKEKSVKTKLMINKIRYAAVGFGVFVLFAIVGLLVYFGFVFAMGLPEIMGGVK